jgi:hypothetical protein
MHTQFGGRLDWMEGRRWPRRQSWSASLSRLMEINIASSFYRFLMHPAPLA